MNIRTAIVSDFDEILTIEKQISELHYNARPDLINKEKIPFNFEHFRKCIEDENYKIFVAEENNTIVGVCITQKRSIKDHLIFNDMVNMEIEDLCVDKRYQNKGIGKKLFEKVVEYSKENKINKIELSVWEFNKNAKKFYEHLGMKTRISRMEINI
jgi:ribosomal protein S18 acetylase RimI-like enzyme